MLFVLFLVALYYGFAILFVTLYSERRAADVLALFVCETFLFKDLIIRE